LATTIGGGADVLEAPMTDAVAPTGDSRDDREPEEEEEEEGTETARFIEEPPAAEAAAAAAAFADAVAG
jgi:hypothetical protein